MNTTYKQIFDLYAEIELYKKSLKDLQEKFLDCANYDATMEGPKFKGWNISSLNRLRVEIENEQRQS